MTSPSHLGPQRVQGASPRADSLRSAVPGPEGSLNPEQQSLRLTPPQLSEAERQACFCGSLGATTLVQLGLSIAFAQPVLAGFEIPANRQYGIFGLPSFW